jgi:hypothetical protein
VRRAVSVQLDRQPRAADAECGEELALSLERLPHRDGLLHPPEHGLFPFALEANRNWACAGLEGHLVDSERGADHERRPQHRRAGEGQLCSRREDANKHIAAVLRREEEDGLSEVHLSGQVLHLLRGERPAIGEHSKLVALQRLRAEHVADEVRVQPRRSVPVGDVWDDVNLRNHRTPFPW